MNVPFNKPLYLKSLAAVGVAMLVLFATAVVVFDYEPTAADPFGAPVAAALIAYLVHLGLWNPEQ